MSIPPEVSSTPYPRPFFLPLRNDFSMAPALSPRIRRAAAEDEELDVFAAEQYFSGAMDMLKPRKTSPEKKLPFVSPPPQICSAFLEPTVAPLMGWKHPLFSLFSCFRKSPCPASTKEEDNSFPETSWATQAWKQKRNQSIRRKMKRSFGTVTADPDVDFFRQSSSVLFELDAPSIRTNAFQLEKSFKYSSAGETFGEATAAPIEGALNPVGCWGREPLNVAAGVRRGSVKLQPTKWDSTTRPRSNLSATPKISAPISALSSRLPEKASAMRR